MKHTFCFRMVLTAVLAAVLPVFGATKTVTWSLPADWEANVEYGEEKGRFAIRGSDFGCPSEPVGAPALPFMIVELPVAPATVLSNCAVEATWAPVETSLRPSIIQAPHIVGEASVETTEDPQYFCAEAYPRTVAEATLQTFSGVNTILLKVTPYRWNGVRGVLEKATTLRVTCETDEPVCVRMQMRLAGAAERIDMVIISPPAFTNLWLAYVDYRKETHPNLNILIKNTAEIYNEYTGVDDAQRIHKYLEDLYANNQLKYAILGAGTQKSTYNREKEIQIRNNVAAGSMYYASDLYYSCMEKKGGAEVWDYGGDGVFLGYKKPGGGYACDTAAQVDWTPEIACFRFPLREKVFLRGIASKTYREYSAEQQMNGLISKLRRVESTEGNFTGDFKAGFSGKKTFSAWQRGRTDDKVAGEHAFFDWDTNPWSASHTTNVDDWEYYTRWNIYNYITPYRPLTQVWCGSSDKGTGANIYNNDLEFNAHVSHGQKQTAQPFEAFNFFINTKIQKILNFSFSCQTGHLDMENYDAEGNICFAEACILNPHGGALATFNNTREGWGADRDYYEMLSLLVHVSMSEAFYSLSDGTAADAFIKGHNRIVNRNGGINPSSTMAACYVETLAMGDPLVRLADYPTSETFAGSVNGRCVKNATMPGTTSVDGNLGVEYLTVAPAAAGDTVIVNGDYTLKAFNKLTVNNGNLQWDAAGGVGRNGIEFTGSRGDLTFAGSNVRYFGPRFNNVGNIRVNGSGVTLDFDKTGSVRDITSLAFTGGGASSNAIRSREGGIFKDDFTIPVTDGTLWLNTINVGGVADKRSAAPLFALTNSTLKICENPHWGTEFLSRGVTMNNSTIDVNYQSVGFGPAVNNAGFNLDILSGTNYINGAYDAEISGMFKTDIAEGAKLIVQTPLTKSGRTGSLLKTGSGTLELRASNAFQGGVTIREGMLVAGSQSPSALAAGEVTVEAGGTLKLESIPSTSITKLTVKEGGKLILPGDVSKASYGLIDPLKGSLDFQSGSIIVNENAPDVPLRGETTSDGYFANTEKYINWGRESGDWVMDGSLQNWLTSSNTPAAYAEGSSLQFHDHGTEPIVIGMHGQAHPDYINFRNRFTPYRFTKACSDAKLGVAGLYTIGETSFEPDLDVSAKFVVAAGKTTANNLAAASITVAPEGALRMTGAVTPVTTISKIVLSVTDFPGWSTPIGISYQGYALNELEFYHDGELQRIPVGTVVAGAGSGNNDSMTVTGYDASGKMLYDGGGNLHNLFDGNAGTGWGWYNNSNTIGNSKPNYTITITLGSPMRMFTGYRFGSADKAERNPKAWTVKVTENLSGSTTQVDSKSGMSGTAANWWPSASYPYEVSYNGASSANLAVAEGGTLYLNGSIGAAVTLEAGARLAVTNDSCMTVSKGMTLGGNVTLDVSEAADMGWTKVLSGANLAATDIYKFKLTTDNAAAKIVGGDLYVATHDIVPGPYALSVSGAANWNTSDWTANGAKLMKTWGDSVTLPTGDAVIDVSGDATLTIDTAVNLGSVVFTNSSGQASTLTVNGPGTFVASVLDFSGYNGKVVWNPDIAGASVICGTNDVTLAQGNGATLTVGAGGVARIAGTFQSYANDAESAVRFIGTGRTLTMGQVPSKGALSFQGATLTGSYQNTAITYLVEDGDAVVMNAASDNMAARNTGSFDIRGGSLTVNPGGSAWWFGDNGHSRFTMTGGSFTCTANGMGTTGSGNGLLIGYTTDGAFPIELDISGGVFSVPNSSLNFYNPATMIVSGEGRVRAKGVFAGSSNVGNLNVESGGTFEIGSIGLAAKAVNCNLFGGTLAGYENGAKTEGTISITGAGTLAAVAGTTFTVSGGIVADGATLTVGVPGRYEGVVRLGTLPEGVNRYVVDAGTLHFGFPRPTTKTLGASAGAVAVTLTNQQISDAKTKAVKIIRAKRVPTGGVKVYSTHGIEQTGVTVAIANGYLTVRTSHDNDVETVEGARWGNAGDTTIGGIATSINQGNYNDFTINFGETGGMIYREIGGDGEVRVSKIRFAIRDNPGSAPTGLALTQGDTTIASSSVTVGTQKDFVCYMSDYLTNNKQKYSLCAYTFTFDDERTLDTGKDILMRFTGVETAGIRVVQPTNAKLVNGGWTPVVEIVGDFSRMLDVGETGGDSVSINVGGGATSTPGKLIADAHEAGAYPIAGANWNQDALRTATGTVDTTIPGLKEVLSDGTVVEGPMSVRLTASTTYSANGKSTTTEGNGELMFGYLDDGGTGAKIVVCDIPYTRYDVYVYMGSDVTGKSSGAFGPVMVESGTFVTNYPASGQAWGSADSTHGTVTLTEGQNYFKVTGLTGGAVAVCGSTKGNPSGTRCGLAGIQIVNTGTRGRVEEPIDADQLVMDFAMTADNVMKVVYKTVDGGVTNLLKEGSAITFVDNDNLWRGVGNKNIDTSDTRKVARFTGGTWQDYPVPNSNLEAGGSGERYWEIKIPLELDDKVCAISNVLAKAFITNSGGADDKQPIDAGKTYAVGLQFVSGNASTNIGSVTTDVLGSTVVNAKTMPCEVMLKSGYLKIRMGNASSTLGAFGGIQGLVFDIDKSANPTGPDEEGPDEDVTVGPLMAEKWYQRGAYNQFTPVVGGGRSPAGCVATAFAQMFHHYRWPVYTYRTTEGRTTYGGGKALLDLAIDGRMPFRYGQMPDENASGSLPAAYETGRFMLWVDSLSRMHFDGGSGNTDYHFPPEYASYWYEKGYEILTKDVEELDETLMYELDFGRPVQLTINGHQVVIDGYRREGGAMQYHINFGWANYQTSYYTITFNSGENRFYINPVTIGGDSFYVTAFWAGMAPKKTVQLDPLAVMSHEVALAWTFPECHTADLEGFVVADYALNGTMGSVEDDGTVEIPFDRAGYYPIEGVYGIGADSTLSVTVESHNTTEISLVLEYRTNGGAWRTLADIPLSTTEYNPKDGVDARISAVVEPNFSGLVGKVAEFRLKAIRGTNSSDRGSAGEYIRRTRVAFASVGTWTKKETVVGPNARTHVLTGLISGYHAFAVQPVITDEDCEVSEAVGTTVVADAAEIPASPAVEEIVTKANPMTDALVRYVKSGTMVFWVKGNASVTNITAACSHRSFIPVDAVRTRDAGDGWFVITAEPAQALPNGTQMILTLDAESANGEHALQDIVLSVSNSAQVEEEESIAYGDTKVFYGDGTNSYDITAAFTNGTGGAWHLDGTKTVEVKTASGTETISVTPVLSPIEDDEHVAEEPFVMTDDSVAIGVKSIPGLTYRLMRGSEIGAYGHEVDSQKATGTRLKLTDGEKPEDGAFYIIKVLP